MKIIKIFFVFFSFISLLIISGCSLLPYESSSSCNMKKQYGKCIDVEGAYQESVTGVDSGAPELYKVSEGKKDKSSAAKKENGNIESNNSKNISVSKSNENTYLDYQSEKYKELAQIIRDPNTPMLSPARTVRTLIVSYSPKYNGRTLYMPRYVFSIIEPSKFVLGQFKENKDSIGNIFDQ